MKKISEYEGFPVYEVEYYTLHNQGVGYRDFKTKTGKEPWLRRTTKVLVADLNFLTHVKRWVGLFTMGGYAARWPDGALDPEPQMCNCMHHGSPIIHGDIKWVCTRLPQEWAADGLLAIPKNGVEVKIQKGSYEERRNRDGTGYTFYFS